MSQNKNKTRDTIIFILACMGLLFSVPGAAVNLFFGSVNDLLLVAFFVILGLNCFIIALSFGPKTEAKTEA